MDVDGLLTAAATSVTAATALVGVYQWRKGWPSAAWHLNADWGSFKEVGARDVYDTELDIVRCQLTNVGDGDAYNVWLAADEAEIYAQHQTLRTPIGRIEPGETFSFQLRPLVAADKGSVHVKWSQPPNRGRMKGPRTWHFPDLHEPS